MFNKSVMSNGREKKLIYKGSVKDIYEWDKDYLVFHFSDRYSVFDWGEMPDRIPGKGRVLAQITKILFSKLAKPSTWQDLIHPHLETNEIKFLKSSEEFKKIQKSGLKTHYINGDSIKNSQNVALELEEILVDRVHVPKCDECAIYGTSPVKILIPLECIFRFGVAEGSSLAERAEFKEGEKFTKIMINTTTKLENADRPLTEDEAIRLGGFKDGEWDSLKILLKMVAIKLHELFAKQDLDLWDGKLEFAFISSTSSNNREFMLVDSIGLDELRITRNGQQVSKEILRQFYRLTPWYENLIQAKKTHPHHFKEHCLKDLRSSPPNLPHVVIEATAKMYQLVADLLGDEQDATSHSKILLDQNLDLLKNEQENYARYHSR